MMPKSTAMMRPSRVDEQVSRMHVGMEEAVAQRVAQEGLHQRARRAPAGRARAPRARRDRRAACRRSIRASARPRAVRSQSTAGTRKSGSSLVFSAISEIAAASSRRSISMVTERASVSTTSIMRSRRASADPLGSARREIERVEIGAKRRSTPGRSTFTATARPSASRPRLVHLRDRGRRDRRTEGREEFAQRLAERRRNRRLGLGLRERRHPVLQRSQIARERGARRRRAASRETARA